MMMMTKNLLRLSPATRRTFTSASLQSLPFAVRVHAPAATLARTLNAEDAPGVPAPAVLVLNERPAADAQIDAHAQRIANSTGAIAVVPDVFVGWAASAESNPAIAAKSLDWAKSLHNLDLLVSALRSPGKEKRKIASLGFGVGGAMSLAFGAKKAASKSPLNACATFYGIPPASITNIDTLPVITPVQAHFGKLDTHTGFSDEHTARQLESRWIDAIRAHGGIHAKGFHHLEEGLFVYPGVGHGFMNEISKSPEFDQEFVNRVWASVFVFLTEHLKTV